MTAAAGPGPGAEELRARAELAVAAADALIPVALSLTEASADAVYALHRAAIAIAGALGVPPCTQVALFARLLEDDADGAGRAR